jgi:hypothetical protein
MTTSEQRSKYRPTKIINNLSLNINHLQTTTINVHSGDEGEGEGG